jgi:hypothetical protein
MSLLSKNKRRPLINNQCFQGGNDSISEEKKEELEEEFRKKKSRN